MGVPILAIAIPMMILFGDFVGPELGEALGAMAVALAVAFGLGWFTRWILGSCSAEEEDDLATIRTESTDESHDLHENKPKDL